MTSRTSAKPMIAAPASATPGLLRTNSRVSSISSSGSLAARLLAASSIAPAALRAYSPYSSPSRSSSPAAVSPTSLETLASASLDALQPLADQPARLVGRLAGQACRVPLLHLVRAPCRERSVHARSSASSFSLVDAGAGNDRVGAFGKLVFRSAMYSPPSRPINPARRALVPALERQSCTPLPRAV